MAYRTKVEVRTKGKVFPAGSILPDDVSQSDLSFLKMKKFVEVVDASSAVIDTEDDDADDEQFDDGFDEMTPGEYKTEDEIRKLRKKKDVYAYAVSIGFELGEDFEEKSLADLQDAVLNFQEEAESNAEGEE
ncbi:MAG: hypothetical protein PHT84_00265 [Candidatus Pacebacteria bacterium]|nr:hypothetical protein [Candidatus Paceibacterota bacterium]